MLFRARAAVATNYGRHYLTFDEFKAICEGVMLAGYEEDVEGATSDRERHRGHREHGNAVPAKVE